MYCRQIKISVLFVFVANVVAVGSSYFHFISTKDIHGICPVDGLTEKLEKLQKHGLELYEKKVVKANKKIAGLEKKLATVELKNKHPTEIAAVRKDLKKARDEHEKLEEDLFPYDASVPLTRMQSEAEYAQRSARAKALEAALLAATGSSNPGGEEDVKPMFGNRAAQMDAAAKSGIELVKKTKKVADKSLRDIFKIGSHVLK